MELPHEVPAQNGAFDNAVVMDTGIGISNNLEILPVTNQTSPESDVPPL
jgi:hypothetical protein